MTSKYKKQYWFSDRPTLNITWYTYQIVQTIGHVIMYLHV